MTIQILYLLTICFKNVRVVKPLSSHASSSELYCICDGYIGHIPNELNKTIKTLLDKKDIKLNIFKEIPKNLIDQIILISDVLVHKQIESIKRSLYLRHHYYYNYDLQNDLSDIKEEKCNQWIEINKMKNIDDKFKLIRNNRLLKEKLINE